jgi:hypothetical protein
MSKNFTDADKKLISKLMNAAIEGRDTADSQYISKCCEFFIEDLMDIMNDMYGLQDDDATDDDEDSGTTLGSRYFDRADDEYESNRDDKSM